MLTPRWHWGIPLLTVSEKVAKRHVSSFRRKPEASVFVDLRNFWTPVFNGVTTFCECINYEGGKD